MTFEDCTVAETKPDGAASLLTDVLGIRIKRELFKFHSQQDWINKAQSRYANCGVPKGYYITVDAAGHVMHMGKCFMVAEKNGLYPVTVYELQTNWDVTPNAGSNGPSGVAAKVRVD